MRLFNFFPVTYETPNGANGGATPPPAQPAPTPQPQGQGQQGQGDGFRSTFFPNVPDEHWQLMEPHLQNVNRHVTQLQQRYAPFSSYTPDAVQGLARFAAAFDQDPVGQWIQIARALQQNGRLDRDLDVDHLEQLITGNLPPESPDGGPADPRDQMIHQLNQQIQQLTERLDTTDRTARERTEDAALKRTTAWMKDQLKAGGIDESLLTDQRLISMFVASGGNAQVAVNDALEYRTALLGGVVQNPKDPATRQKQQLSLDNGVPKVPAERKSSASSTRRGMFKDVSAGAEQFIARANQS